MVVRDLLFLFAWHPDVNHAYSVYILASRSRTLVDGAETLEDLAEHPTKPQKQIPHYHPRRRGWVRDDNGVEGCEGGEGSGEQVREASLIVLVFVALTFTEGGRYKNQPGSRESQCVEVWLAGSHPEARGKMAQKGSLISDLEALNCRAPAPDLEDHFDDVVDVTLSIDATRNR